LANAVAAPRFHHQWLPDNVDVEPGLLSPATRAALAGLGYTFAPRDPWGADEAIVVDRRHGRLYGASDPRRRSGLALGY
jgi:gamma-glutamyltranspeptidase/glutathione hydrolase